MILRSLMATLIFLNLSPTFAMGSRGGVMHNHYPECKSVGGDHAPQMRGPMCSAAKGSSAQQLVTDGAELSDSLALSAVIHQAQPEASHLLNRSIEARDKILACLNSQTADCKARVQALTSTLEDRVSKLRLALVLEKPSLDEIDPMTVNTTDFSISLPTFAGGTSLPDPTVEESNAAEKLRKAVRVSLEGEKNIAQRQVDAQLHKEAHAAATRILLEMPLVARFTQVPIRKTQLKKALLESKEAMMAWRKSVLDPASPGQFLIDYPNFIGPILKQHPEYCHAVELAYLHSDAMEQMKSGGAVLGKGLLTIAACVYSGGLGCAAAAGALALADVGGNLDSEKLLVKRMTALGTAAASSHRQLKGDLHESQKLIQASDVDNAHRDFLVSLALDSLAVIPIAKSVKEIGHVHSGAAPVSHTVEALVSEEGELGSTVVDAAKDYAVSNAKETAAQVAAHTTGSQDDPAEAGSLIYNYLFPKLAAP